MAKDIAVGDESPELSLPDQHGKPVTLQSFKGKQIVLYDTNKAKVEAESLYHYFSLA